MAQIVGTAFLKILLQIAKNRVIYYIKAIILHLNVIFSPITLKIAQSGHTGSNPAYPQLKRF